MKFKPFFTLLKMELLVWLRVKINLFFVVAWPVLWLLMMTLVIPSGNRGSLADILQFYFPSCMALVMLSAMISLSIRIAVKKEGGILQRLKVVPFPVSAYFMVQFVCAIVMSVIGLACISIVAFFMKMPVKGSLLSMVVVFFLGCFTFTAIGFFIGGFSRKIVTANIISILVMFVMMFMSDMFVPLSDIQSVVFLVGSLLPAQAFLSMARGIMISGMRLTDYSYELLVLFIWGIGAVVLSLPTFKFDVKR